MKIALRCEKCREEFMQAEEDLCLRIDAYEMKITFVCLNKKCKHENILDISNWQKQQKRSSLPRIGVM